MPDFPIGCLWYVACFAAGILIDRLADVKLSDVFRKRD